MSTDDAQVKQDIVSVSPQVNGQIVQVFVRNGAQVKRGDLLFRIDPQPYRVALEQAEAQLATARLQTQVLRTTAAGHERRYHGCAGQSCDQAQCTAPAAGAAEARASRRAPTMTMRSMKSAPPRRSWPMPGSRRQCSRGRRTGRASRRSRRRRQRSTRPGSICRAPTCVRRWTASSRMPTICRSARWPSPVSAWCRSSTAAQRGSKPTSRKRTSAGWCRASMRSIEGRRLSRQEVRGSCPEHRRRNRQPVLAAPGAECQRQLGQGHAARAGADCLRRQPFEADDRRPVGDGHRRFRTRSNPWPSTPARRNPSAAVGRAADRHHRGDDGRAAAGARHDNRQRRLAAHAADLSATQDTDQLGADELYRRLGDRPADQRLACRQGRTQAAAADLGGRLHRRVGAVRDGHVARARWSCSARLQGVSGAFIVPLAQATLFDINPREKHGQAMALFGGGVMIGPILGPVLGGWLTDNYNWRWVFLVNLPVGILCVLIMLRFMPKTETHEAQLRHVRLRICSRSRWAGYSCSSIAASRRTGSRAGKSGSSSASRSPRRGCSSSTWRRPSIRCSSGRCSPTATSRPAWCSWR